MEGPVSIGDSDIGLPEVKKKVRRRKKTTTEGAERTDKPTRRRRKKKPVTVAAEEGQVEGATAPAAVRKKKKKAKPKVDEQGDTTDAPATRVKSRSGKARKPKSSPELTFQRPDVLNPLRQATLMRDYFQNGEEGVLRDEQVFKTWLPALTGRVLVALCKDPGNARHRFVYALLVNESKPFDEVKTLFEQSIDCDTSGELQMVRETLGRFLERNERFAEAEKVYDAAFAELYKRQANAGDVNLMTLYGAFASERQVDTAAKLKDVWKDCALLCPSVPMTQGNYGIHLFRTGDKEAARWRIAEAAKGGDVFWNSLLTTLFP